MNRPSPLRALVWKELRQQRWVFLVAALLPVAMALMVRWFADGDLAVILGGLTLGLSALLLGANAFAGEEEDRSAEFQRAMPVSRGGVFWVKAGVCCGLIIGVLCADGIAFVGTRWLLWAEGVPRGWEQLARRRQEVVQLLLSLPPAFFALTMVPAMLASITRRTLLCILLSIVFVLFLVFAVAAPLAFTVWDIRSSLPTSGWSTVVLVCVTGAVSTLIARLLWGWRVSALSRGRRVAAGVGVTALFVALAWVPILAYYAHVTLFAPLSYFDSRHRLEFRTMGPRAKWLMLSAFSPMWRSGQSCLLDVESGRTVWPSRLTVSVYAEESASPDNRWYVLCTPKGWLPSVPWRSHLYFEWAGDPPEGRYCWYVFSPETGSRIYLNEIWPEMPTRIELNKPWFRPCGWVDGRTIALEGSDADVFINVETREVRCCRQPAELKGKRFTTRGGTPTDRGVIVPVPVRDLAAAQPLTLLRFSPDLTEAETISIPVDLAQPHIYCASREGDWAVVEGATSGGRQRVLVSLRGKVAPVLLGIAQKDHPVNGAWCFREAQPALCGIVGSQAIVVSLEDMSRRTFDLLADAREEITGWGSSLAPGGRYVGFVVIKPPRSSADLVYRIADFDGGRYWDLPVGPNQGELRWLDGERLIMKSRTDRPYVLSIDGAGRHPLLRE